MKQCNTCHIEKGLDEFSRAEIYSGGYRHICKSCAALKAAYYYSKNNERKRITPHSYSDISAERRKLLSKFKNICTKARNRKHEVTINMAYLEGVYDSQKGLCRYSKLPLSIETNRLDTISLDRIDSSKGYIHGNVQFVCAAVNRMKQEFSEKDFLKFCTLIANNVD